MKALDNHVSFKPTRGICNSDSYNGSSDLTQSILGSITQLGQTAIIANSNGGVQVPTYSRPNYLSPTVGTRSSMGSLLLFGLLLAGGFVVYKNL